MLKRRESHFYYILKRVRAFCFKMYFNIKCRQFNPCTEVI